MQVNIEQRSRRARELFLGGYNCAQAVFIAYCDVAAMSEEIAATVAAPFGGGLGRLREVCGAVSGMTMVAGFLSPNAQPNDNDNKKKLYSLVQSLAEEFRAENGAIVCRELLGLAQQKDDPTPSPRTGEYYKRRPCADYVEIAARMVGETINAME
ncbi:MAG: C_GCAxxG_C_C family protein [Alistipes sp.]|nr:C_GCAxxG_C_C family protein [Alistipes sp.]